MQATWLNRVYAAMAMERRWIEKVTIRVKEMMKTTGERR